jgi:hypothetical protein
LPISPVALHWTGVVLACLVYLFIIVRVVDGIWDFGLTGILYEVVWNLILRRVLRWLISFYIVFGFAVALVIAFFTFNAPWKSLGAVLLWVLALRVLVWLFWLLQDGSEVARSGRNERAAQQNIHGWERFLIWCFHWGEYEGLLSPEEKKLYRDQRHAKRKDSAFVDVNIPIGGNPKVK